jgi:hypothetical protein
MARFAKTLSDDDRRAVADVSDLHACGEVHHPDPHVAVVREPTGNVTRWLQSIAGFWLCVDEGAPWLGQ